MCATGAGHERECDADFLRAALYVHRARGLLRGPVCGEFGERAQGRRVSLWYLSVWTTPFGTTTNPCEGRRVTPVSEPDAERPTWGPGNRIAYERIDRNTNVATIALVSRELGSVPCDVTPSSADNRNPNWLPPLDPAPPQ